MQLPHVVVSKLFPQNAVWNTFIVLNWVLEMASFVFALSFAYVYFISLFVRIMKYNELNNKGHSF